ncbi:MAG: tRNA (adenosine(37)-N6)-threonylcarbamoyltransferase complex transferase subunit TsaD [Sneathiellaceae bacterium]
MIVLGLETSCDETAAALVAQDAAGRPRILAERVYSQVAEHAPYAGVVPEIAARAHVARLDILIAEVMAEAGLDYDALDGIAATAGPGLIGGLLVGLTTAKAIALAAGRPLVAVNHLEAHALSPRLVAELEFPYLLLLVSGGHCQLLTVREVGAFTRLGSTIDDAVGEAFDKVAKMLGLGYPGGPAVERAAADGDPAAIPLPRPMKGRPGCDFSFSGLKNAVRLAIAAAGEAPPVADICAGFQRAVTEVTADRVGHAMDLHDAATAAAGRTLVVAGGVAANAALKAALAGLAGSRGWRLLVPPARLCTDNGAMVALAGLERLRRGLTDPLDTAPRPRWPLDPGAAPLPFAGAKA